MGRTWAELDQLERRNGVSFLREPDSGFVWAAYRWVRGVKLEDVLDSVPGLTPGDFVRSVKQLIDLLDQIAAAASYDAKGNAAARAKTRSVTPDDLGLSLPCRGQPGEPASVAHPAASPPAAQRDCRRDRPRRDRRDAARRHRLHQRRGLSGYRGPRSPPALVLCRADDWFDT